MKTTKSILVVLFVLATAQIASAYYCPSAGRWVSRDPLGERGGKNLYRAGYNTLVNSVDFRGLSPVPGRVLSAEEAIQLMQPPPIGGSLTESLVTIALKTKLQQNGVPAQVINYLIANASGTALAMLYLGNNRFDPGGKDDGSDKFVYTCRCGWIDLGHFFASAGGAALFSDALRPILGNDPSTDLIASLGSFTAGVQVEVQQMKDKEKGLDGWSASAWTLEDLPSDWMGAFFGPTVPRTDYGNSFAKIQALMSQFFQRCGAVNPHTKLSDGRIAGDLLNADAEAYGKAAMNKGFNSINGVNPYNFTPLPKKTISHNCLCGK